jgi:hypothetical protein
MNHCYTVLPELGGLLTLNRLCIFLWRYLLVDKLNNAQWTERFLAGKKIDQDIFMYINMYTNIKHKSFQG